MAAATHLFETPFLFTPGLIHYVSAFLFFTALDCGMLPAGSSSIGVGRLERGVFFVWHIEDSEQGRLIPRVELANPFVMNLAFGLFHAWATRVNVARGTTELEVASP